MENDNERERWRGSVTEQLIELRRSQETLFRLVDTLSKALQILTLEVNTIVTKIAVYAALGGFVGGGIMAGMVAYFTRK